MCEGLYGKEQYKASKQPNWATVAVRPRYVPVPKQGPNECGYYALKFAEVYNGEDLAEDIHNEDVSFLFFSEGNNFVL